MTYLKAWRSGDNIMMTPIFLDGYMMQFTEEELQRMHEHRWTEISKINPKHEYTGCPLCDSVTVDVLVETEHDGSLGQCKECGLAYAYHRLVTEVLRYYYLYYTPSSLTSIEVRSENAKTRPLQINYDLDHIERYATRGRMLDVGCASGDFLVYARSRGWVVEGTELSTTCMQFCEEACGIPVHHGNILEINFGEMDKMYDVVALRHSVEHLTNPVEELLYLRAYMEDGGVLFITTPEHANDIELLKEHHMMPLHVANYTKDTIKLLLEKAGFSMVDYTQIPGNHFTTNSELDCMMVVAIKG
jgi:2-polyprenyl-3-methyl-5-hydroxy-6-metoxy-1,4-benzoquinol methylase